MQIRDLEGKAGLDRATIRYYEKEGLIIPKRKENGYREYSDDNLGHLLKIKLLRQLGMSLDTIKSIQQGSTDFNQALSMQIRNLENVIQAAGRAKDVCSELYQANISYDDLDAVYYLQLLDRKQARIATGHFREYVQRPYYPLRRFMARMTDYAILRMMIEFLIVVVLRIRPYSEWLSLFITYGIPFLMIPTASWMIHKWGTTPGKWIYGISVLSENGCKLSFVDAMEREWWVFIRGYGFGIPIWSVVRLVKSYNSYQEYDMEWDRSCELQFKDLGKRMKGVIAGSIAIIIVINFLIVTDAPKPRFRGDITISEFAENYNFYYKITEEQFDTGFEMKSDGTWLLASEGNGVFDIVGKPMYPNQNFEFNMDGTCIKSIRYENTWTDVGMLYPVIYKCKIAAVTAVLSQKGNGIFDILSFVKIMDSSDLLHDGNITYRNICISWNIETENCIALAGIHYTTDDETKPSMASVEFVININN